MTLNSEADAGGRRPNVLPMLQLISFDRLLGEPQMHVSTRPAWKGRLKQRYPRPYKWYRRVRYWVFRLTSKSRLFTDLVIPAAVSGIFLGLVYVFGAGPESTAGEIALTLGTLVVAFLTLQALRTVGIGPLLAEVQRIAEATQEPSREFLLNLAKQRLVDLREMVSGLAQQNYTPDPPESMAAWFASFFTDGGHPYKGVDSHIPSDYLQTYDWYLTIHERHLPGSSDGPDVRVLIASKNGLTDDYLRNPDAYLWFHRWHQQHRVGAYWLDEGKARELRNKYGLGDADVGLWEHYGVLFTPSSDGRVTLSMRFPHESPGPSPTYEQLKAYVSEVESVAEPLSDGPPGLELVDEELADRWADYLDPEKRMSEGGPFARFLFSALSELSANRGNVHVLDAAAGIGCDSITLLTHEGFSVQSNEVDAHLQRIARQFAREYGVDLDLKARLWETMPQDFPGSMRFDALLVLGNSLCLVEDAGRRKQAVESFYEMLVPGGLLLIDERNFQAILDRADEIMRNPLEAFPPATQGDVMYAGRSLRGYPGKISETSLRWRFFHNTPAATSVSDVVNRRVGKHDLILYPFKYGELYDLLLSVGFELVDVYADLRSVSDGLWEIPPYENVSEAQFFTYVVRRPFERALTDQ